MSTVVKNNIAAQMALGELNKNVNKAGVLLSRVSSGLKIVGAKDDAGQFAISEKMREEIRSLLQDDQNVQNGSTLFKIAEGGVDSIVEELRNLKELAINAANDTNTDRDRATIQKEFTQKMANINDIATMTNYNGKPLLDGTYARKIKGGGPGEEIPPPTFVSAKKDVTEPEGTATQINADNYNITANGVYELATDAGKITIADGVTDVKFTQSTTDALDGVSITGPSDGNANIWIEGLNISNSSENIFKFQGEGNVLTVKGENVLTETNSKKAAVNIGGGLNVQGEGDDHSLKVTTPSGSNGAAIGSDSGEKLTGDVNVINLNLKDAYAYYGSVIGSGGYGGTVGNVSVENCTIEAKGHWNAVIGSGHSGSSAGDIWVVNSSVTIGKVDGDVGLVDTGIGSGYSGSTCGDVYILDSEVEIHNQLSACIGAGDAASCGDIFISASTIKGQSSKGACIGSGQGGSTAGDITITNATEISHKSPDGAAIGTGANGKVGKISVTQSCIDLLDASAAYSDDTHQIEGIGRGRGGSVGGGVDLEIIGPTTSEGTPLKIHHGTKANQAINFYIEDMHTKSLGTGQLLSEGKFLNEDDEARYWALSYDKRKQDTWMETVTIAQNKTLDDISVTTKKNANIAVRVLDGALDYALNEATYLGSYLQRLDYTSSNVVTMTENVQASESTIRDSDMAKEMTDYTKANVLVQSAQAMLAQANQNSSAVLSLLQ